MLNFILIAVIAASIFWLGFLIFRRWPDLKNLDVDSIVEHRQDEAKSKILQARLIRGHQDFKIKLKDIFSPRFSFFSDKLENFKRKISELEEKYQNKTKQTGSAGENFDELSREAEEFLKKDNFQEAEKKLIEIISLDRKNIWAYERLGDLYFRTKDYDQAEEIYKYLLKLKILDDKDSPGEGNLDDIEAAFLSSLEITPRVAVYYDSLGQVYEVSGRLEKALDSYLKAITVEPNSPKYLTKLIELGIKLDDRPLAKKIYNRLKQINPENARLDEFEQAIEKMRKS